MFACAKGHTDVVKNNLQEHKYMNFATRSNKPNMEAARTGCTEIVRMLLAHPDVNPAAKSNYAIRMASRKGHKDVVQLLLADSRVDPKANQYEALRSALFAKHFSS
jgi:ankyrin repeat protein